MDHVHGGGRTLTKEVAQKLVDQATSKVGARSFLGAMALSVKPVGTLLALKATAMP